MKSLVAATVILVALATGAPVQAQTPDLRALAEQGDAVAQLVLGVMYGNGEGTPQDFVEAHMWANLAASQLSGEDRDLAVRHRDGLAAQMTPDQIAEAQRRAREWFAAHPREPEPLSPLNR